MADGLADILAGGGPLGPQLLGADIAGSQALDPARLGATTPSLPALGLWQADVRQGQAMDLARQIASQQTAAIPAIGKYLAADDPIKAAAADTGGDPVARWQMLRSTPEQVAQMRQAMAAAELNRQNAALAALNVKGFTGLQNEPQTPLSLSPSGGPRVGGAAALGAQTSPGFDRATGRDYLAEFEAAPTPEARAQYWGKLANYQKLQLQQQALRRGKGIAGITPQAPAPAPATTTTAGPPASPTG
jgi:hypothetical protein